VKFTIIIAASALLLMTAVPAPGQTSDYQKGVADGLRIGFFMNQKYVDAKEGINITGYNTEVARYNAWIESIFGKDPSFLMSPMPLGAMSRPVIVANNTTGNGIVHAIDGGVGKGPSYTTNDMNLLPDAARDNIAKSADGGEYLGGV
jgi:hypothetical protein